MRANLRCRPLRNSSSVQRRLALSPISTAVKSTEALSGARAHELGGSYDWHCLIRDFQQCRSLTPAPGARWPNRQCIPSVGGPSLPVFQCLAGTRAPTRNRFLRAMIRGEGIRLGLPWTELLAKDYCDPRYHISFARAIGRRLRRTYPCLRVGTPSDMVGAQRLEPWTR